jgi:hypothetical protein
LPFCSKALTTAQKLAGDKLREAREKEDKKDQ